MKNQYAYLETFIFVSTALSLLIIAALFLQVEVLNAIYPSRIWAIRAQTIQQLMMLYGAGFIFAAFASFIMIRYYRYTFSQFCFAGIRACAHELWATSRWLIRLGKIRNEALWFVLIMAIGAAVRFAFLAQPMRYDEAMTFLLFVNHDIMSLFNYLAPNNHVLHTLLVRISVELFGSHPIAIRLPAVLAGLFSIPLIVCLARTLSNNRRSGFLAAVLVAVFPYMVLYDTMARGYSLLIVFTLVLLLLGVRITRQPSRCLCALSALIIALGMLAMPSFLFPSAGVLCWISIILLQQGHKPVRVFFGVVAPCTIMAVIVTGILYTPVIFVSNGIDSVINNRFVEGLPLQAFLMSLPAHITKTIIRFVRGIPIPVLCALLVFFAAGLYTTVRKGRWAAFLLIPAVLAGSTLVLFAKQAVPFDRTWIFLLPLFFLFIDAGLSNIVKCADVKFRAMILLVAGCAAAAIVKSDMISSFPDTGHFPQASVLAQTLSREMTSADRVIAKCPADFPVRFYMREKNLPEAGSSGQEPFRSREFFVIKPSKYSLDDMTDKTVSKLLSIGDAELYVEAADKNL